MKVRNILNVNKSLIISSFLPIKDDRQREETNVYSTGVPRSPCNTGKNVLFNLNLNNCQQQDEVSDILEIVTIEIMVE